MTPYIYRMTPDVAKPGAVDAAATEFPDLRAIELLVEVARRGSVGAAGREVGLSQPQASRMVAKLERETELTLIRRTPSGSSLTDEGRLVVDWAAPVLESATRLLAGVASLRARSSGNVTVGASLTIGEHLAPLWLRTFTMRHPELRVRLRVANSTVVTSDVRAGVVDLGFVEMPRRPRGLRTTVVATDELVVVAHPSHPWSKLRTALPLAQLAATPLTVREVGSGVRETLDAALAAYDRHPPAMELSSNEAIRAAVAAGAAPSVVSRLAAGSAARARGLCVVAIAGPPLRRRLRAVWREPRRPSGWAAEFIEIARSVQPSAPSADWSEGRRSRDRLTAARRTSG